MQSLKNLLNTQNGQKNCPVNEMKEICYICGVKEVYDNGMCEYCLIDKRREMRANILSKSLLEKIAINYQNSIELYPNLKLESIFYYGNAGTGKTSRAFAQIQNNIKRIKSFEYIKVNKLLMLLNPRNEGNILETEAKFENVQVLILDDLSIQNFTEASIRYLFMILDYRLENAKTTIITSLLTPKELALKLPEEVMSRLNELCKFKQIEGRDFRW